MPARSSIKTFCLSTLRVLSREVVAEVADKDPFAKKVYASYKRFYDGAKRWSDVSELAYLQARARS